MSRIGSKLRELRRRFFRCAAIDSDEATRLWDLGIQHHRLFHQLADLNHLLASALSFCAAYDAQSENHITMRMKGRLMGVGVELQRAYYTFQDPTYLHMSIESLERATRALDDTHQLTVHSLTVLAST